MCEWLINYSFTPSEVCQRRDEPLLCREILSCSALSLSKDKKNLSTDLLISENLAF